MQLHAAASYVLHEIEQLLFCHEPFHPVSAALNGGQVSRYCAVGLECHAVTLTVQSHQVPKLILRHHRSLLDDCHSFGQHLDLGEHVGVHHDGCSSLVDLTQSLTKISNRQRVQAARWLV